MEEGQHQTAELLYERLGTQFDACMSAYDVHRRQLLIARFLSAVPPDSRVLEVGCGTGKISTVIRKRTERLTVSDVSELLARSVGGRIGCDWSRQDACHLQYPDRSFDAVVSSECIEHTLDPLRALQEMCRVLKPGGVLIVTTPNRLWYPVLLVSQWLRLRKFRGTIEHWLWPVQMFRCLRAEGMQILGVRGCHLYPWQIPVLRLLLPFFDRFGGFLWPVMINTGVCARKQ